MSEADAHAALLRLCAAIASRDASALRDAVVAAVRVAQPAAVEETILQTHLFVGFPDAINALALWRERSGLPAPPALGEGCGSWEVRGPSVCEVVYGDNYPRLRRNVAALHPEMDRWMVEGGYGRVLGRPGLSLTLRELCTVALLVVWDVPRQLHSHLRGALNSGASVSAVGYAVEIGCGYADVEAATRARALWSEVRPRARR
ncbi:MAG: carboxymuconolactone decarboxylase family protein [Gemmatimonadota bacterium]|nr:carboxymuconolactone decarboxylase family protein [Gemmatimonadota bacterium]